MPLGKGVTLRTPCNELLLRIFLFTFLQNLQRTLFMCKQKEKVGLTIFY